LILNKNFTTTLFFSEIQKATTLTKPISFPIDFLLLLHTLYGE